MTSSDARSIHMIARLHPIAEGPAESESIEAGGVAGTAEIMRFLAEDISKHTYVNIMDQYRPCWKTSHYPPLNRQITREEFEDAVEAAKTAGLHRVLQEQPGSAVAWIAEV
jgi:putative pyruvate formate lyase activating enzyme